jgi:MOSC domain-containing protein YiiM
VRQDPTRLNLRQVPLVRAELHDELRAAGFRASAGQMGENVTTRGTDLLGLPPGTTLRLGEVASVEVTGLRSPCRQLDNLQRGLMKAVLDRDERGNLVRKAGIMGPVLTGGELPPEDEIRVVLPPGLRRPLDKVSRASSDPPAAPA